MCEQPLRAQGRCGGPLLANFPLQSAWEQDCEWQVFCGLVDQEVSTLLAGSFIWRRLLFRSPSGLEYVDNRPVERPHHRDTARCCLVGPRDVAVTQPFQLREHFLEFLKGPIHKPHNHDAALRFGKRRLHPIPICFERP
jgi:hypothetical protein